MVDETKDLSKQEQLSVILRYVDPESTVASIQERFLTFFPASNLNAESLSQYIKTILEQFSLDPQMIVSQGYDGASVMSGNCSGVQQRMREVAPYAFYVHCRAHILNLVLVDCAKKNSFASEFFALIQNLYVFMSTSKAHVLFLEKQKQLHPEKQSKELQRLSDTRWACRSLALNAIASTYDAIIATLEYISDDSDKAKAVEAIGLLHQIRSLRFLASLIIFQRLMSVTKCLSDQLQSKSNDLSYAASLVSSTVATLKEFREDKTWDHTFQYITDVAELNDIEQVLEVGHRRRREQPRRLQDSIITYETTGQNNPSSCDSISQFIKVNMYLPVIDHILSELNRRFSANNIDLFNSLDAFNPQSPHFLNFSLISSFASLYGIASDDDLITECRLATRTFSTKELESVSSVYTDLLQLQAAF